MRKLPVRIHWLDRVPPSIRRPQLMSRYRRGREGLGELRPSFNIVKDASSWDQRVVVSELGKCLRLGTDTELPNTPPARVVTDFY